MRGGIRGLAAGVAMSVMLLAAPSGASGDVTIGETFGPEQTCSAGVTFLQSESPASSYAAPLPGVITSWSYQAGSSPADLKLKVARPLGGDDFRVTGESDVEDPLANGLRTFDTNIRVEAGDVIGFYLTASGACGRFPGGYVDHLFSADVAPGESETFTAGGGLQLNLSARLEPFRCAGRDATIAGTNGPNVLEGTPDDDVIVGLGGKDTIKAFGGNDIVCGSKGKDSLRGAAGDDNLRGGRGADRLKGGSGRDRCAGGKGEDVARRCEVEKSV